ncbi:Cryptochrome DASH [Pseudoalteromonas sp. THAF3]|uniref:DASH family cryptochrome n=1 Tax=Pseudoalteromonas sp. THAF3 TaxID=2587843 RepID=UPI001268BB6D|nr:DASH family cryptochrome [Pseudoalteromonas sp. THAF3]QFU05436.1 Cryptochrome DASH [Pseudoalteromonas sp. THAF3]
MKTGLYLFYHDLRLEDNQTLRRLSSQVDRLILAYCPLHTLTVPSRAIYNAREQGPARTVFIEQTLHHLSQALAPYHHSLCCIDNLKTLDELVGVHDITHLGVGHQHGWDERMAIAHIKERYNAIELIQDHDHTLFTLAQLPGPVDELPSTFSQFRKAIESELSADEPLAAPTQLAPSVPVRQNLYVQGDASTSVLTPWFAQSAAQALENYFATDAPSRYKETRNALQGQHFSTALSPWLANGALSARLMLSKLRNYEAQHGANESTYWIYFELLWREYFQWLAIKQGKQLYYFAGANSAKPQTSFYAQRYQAWCQGNTPYALVNALMHELNTTGWMSNRGRQIVASCFVNELNLDWRYGAAYFERMLIDYDSASNYGNWQYIAGVGADPRGGRHFNLAKQQQQFDPDGEFISRWQGEASQSDIDYQDYTGWPQQGVTHE